MKRYCNETLLTKFGKCKRTLRVGMMKGEEGTTVSNYSE